MIIGILWTSLLTKTSATIKSQQMQEKVESVDVLKILADRALAANPDMFYLTDYYEEVYVHDTDELVFRTCTLIGKDRIATVRYGLNGIGLLTNIRCNRHWFQASIDTPVSTEFETCGSLVDNALVVKKTLAVCDKVPYHVGLDRPVWMDVQLIKQQYSIGQRTTTTKTDFVCNVQGTGSLDFEAEIRIENDDEIVIESKRGLWSVSRPPLRLKAHKTLNSDWCHTFVKEIDYRSLAHYHKNSDNKEVSGSLINRLAGSSPILIGDTCSLTTGSFKVTFMFERVWVLLNVKCLGFPNVPQARPLISRLRYRKILKRSRHAIETLAEGLDDAFNGGPDELAESLSLITDKHGNVFFKGCLALLSPQFNPSKLCPTRV